MCRLCNPISRFSRPLPFQQNNNYGNKTQAGGNTIIIAGDNYAPINGGGNVNNGAIGCNNNNNGFGKQGFAMMAKMMQFFMQMMAMFALTNQAEGCGCGCGCGAGLDCLG